VGPLLALLSGGLLFLAFPRFDLGWLAWMALVPLLVALRGRRPLAALGLGLLCGAVAFRGIFWWINRDQGVTWPDAVALMLYLGAWVGLFALAFTLITARTRLPAALVAPVLWVAVEYGRGNLGFLALPWGFVAHSQHANLPLIQIASLTGAYGVSFLVVAANAAIADLVLAWREGRGQRRPSIVQGLFVAVILVLAIGWGMIRLATPRAGGEVKVAVVQGNVPQAERWDERLRAGHLDTHTALTRQAVAAGSPRLVVWPETAVATMLTEDLPVSRRLGELARESGVTLLVGSAVRPKFGPSESRRTRLVNSAFVFSPAGRLVAQYDKRRLVPFGEYLPHPSLPWPDRIARGAARFTPGEGATVLALGDARFGVVICWEVIFPDLVRTLVADGAQFVVNMTNEAWFGDTGAPYQFLAINVLRAVENGVAVVRAANTGISGVIDPRGRVVATVSAEGREVFVAGAVTAGVAVSHERTLYTRTGEVLGPGTTILAALLLLVAMRRRPRRG
jgi:apolipoprotein N-acyltransferase